MTTKINSILYSIGKFIDNKILCYNFLFSFFKNFFNIFSRITNILYFNSVVKTLHIFSIVFVIRHYFNYIHQFLLNRIPFLDFPFVLKMFFIFNFGIFYIVIILTLLAYTSKIPSYMKSLYGESIMKTLHYNSPGATASAAAATLGLGVAVTVLVEVGETARCKMMLDAWKEAVSVCASKGVAVPSMPTCNPPKP